MKDDPKPQRPPRGAALSDIRAWDKAYADWRSRNPAPKVAIADRSATDTEH